ncbi:MAG: hypothetical protein DRJ65_07295 [Acidobacteria bacterium]|nr:MAG: hypothetical protein DRJ65_07295 [Acidobacteriota bacterium]
MRFANDKKKNVALLHDFVDATSKKELFGQMIVSWENGIPVMVKLTSTLKMSDIERLLKS